MAPKQRPKPDRDARPLGEPGSFRPDPRPAPLGRMILAQARFETKLLLRNGEQLLLAIVIPALMLIAFAAEPIGTITGGGSRIDYYAPGIIGMAVLSTAFTSRRSPPASSGGTACSSGSAPPRCRAGGCWPASR